MAEKFFSVGSDSADEARKALIAYLNSWFGQAPYRSMLPRSKSIKIIQAGSREAANIMVTVRSEADANPPWPYKVPIGAYMGKNAIENTHQIILNVKADSKGGGKESVSKVCAVLRILFALRDERPERQDLEARGVKFCLESPNALELDSSGFDEEAEAPTQSIGLRCQTDTLID